MSDLDLTKYDGKKVIIVRNLKEKNEKGELSVEIEAQVQVGNQMGLLVKPKGKLAFDMIPADEIEEIRRVVEKLKTLKAKELKPIEHGNARLHLLERHGVTLEWVNSNSEDAAFKYHESVDHEALGLGHIHKAADTSERAEAVKAAEKENAA